MHALRVCGASAVCDDDGWRPSLLIAEGHVYHGRTVQNSPPRASADEALRDLRHVVYGEEGPTWRGVL